ncbi:ROK family protein [Microbacterium luteum]|uniref:ROK family protein n=1 Tax=Microbacterium TaxID=33882 RepID=UPI0008DA386D|nr:ROK family protein [Microbacterium luteum]
MSPPSAQARLAAGDTASRPASLDAVFRYAWDSADFTATDAMLATGLTRSTTIEALEALRELDLVSELPNAREAGDYRKGRPARRFALRDDAAVLVGVDAGNSHVAVTVTDLRSQTLLHRRTTLAVDGDDAHGRRHLISALIDEALAAAGRDRDDVISLCIGVPAPVDAAGRSPQHRNGFWARMNPDLVDELSWAPLVRVDNDASLAAIAEGATGGAVGCDDYVTLLAGERLGAGIVVDGRLLRGAHGGVGEMVAFDHVLGVGGADGLGVRIARLAADAIERGEAAEGSALAAVDPNQLDARTVLALAADGDPAAVSIAEQVGTILAEIVSVLGSMFDPQRVLVSGAIASGIETVVASARRALPTGLDLPAPDLVVSSLGAEVVARGAVAAASASARRHALDVWPLRAHA